MHSVCKDSMMGRDFTAIFMRYTLKTNFFNSQLHNKEGFFFIDAIKLFYFF